MWLYIYIDDMTWTCTSISLLAPKATPSSNSGTSIWITVVIYLFLNATLNWTYFSNVDLWLIQLNKLKFLYEKIKV